MAERTGFEPADVSISGFQDQCLQPLGHLSAYYLSIFDQSSQAFSRRTFIRRSYAHLLRRPNHLSLIIIFPTSLHFLPQLAHNYLAHIEVQH